MRFLDMEPIVCAGCGKADRGDPDEEMTGIFHPTRRIVWMAHRDCAFTEFRIARRMLLPVVRGMRRLESRRWDAFRERLFRDTRRRPSVFTEAVQDMFEVLVTVPMRTVCQALGISPETFSGWVDVLVVVLQRFNLAPRLPEVVEGPRLRLVAPA